MNFTTIARESEGKSKMIRFNTYGRGRKARLMRRDEAGHGGGGAAPATQEQTGNNQGGNSGPGSTGTQTQNNGGQTFDPASFWTPPAPETSPPSAGSAGGESGAGNQTQEQGQGLAQTLSTRIQSAQFQPVFTEAINTQLAEGDSTGFNAAIHEHGRGLLRESLALNAQVVQEYGKLLMNQVGQMLDERLGNRDNEATLETSFPELIAKPALRPVIQSVFETAMKHTKGDRKGAATLAREMLKHLGTDLGTGLGLETAPSDPGGSNSNAAAGLVEELLARRQ